MRTRMIIGVAVAAAALPGLAAADKGGQPNDNASAQAQANAQARADAAKPPAAGNAAAAHEKAAAKKAKHKAAVRRGTANHNVAITPAAVHPNNGHSGKTTICHATGSAKHPYVEITISNNALPAHRRHQDGRDIIPAPAAGCPGPSASKANATPVAGSAAGTGATPAATPAATVLGARVVSRNTPRARVLGARTNSSKPSTLPRLQRGRLPFTGFDVALAIALGLAALGTGSALRRYAIR
jgi:hypothetical protein